MNLSFLSHVETISGIEEVSVFGYLNEDKKPCVKVLDRDEQEPFFEVTPKMWIVMNKNRSLRLHQK